MCKVGFQRIFRLCFEVSWFSRFI